MQYDFLVSLIFLSNVLHSSFHNNFFLSFISAGLFYSVDFSLPSVYRGFKAIALVNNFLLSFKPHDNLKLILSGFLFSLALEMSNHNPVYDYLVTSYSMHFALM